MEIDRNTFMESLVVNMEEDMNAVYNLRFKDEMGVDAGGLKREFYDMIGSTFTNAKYGFFQAITKDRLKYILNPDIFKLK